MKKVSVLIPTWNGTELLKKYLPSVIAAADKLGEKFDEVIVVDDGSTDGTSELMRVSFPGVTYYNLKKNIGFHRAVNYGFKQAKSDVVILLNSDIEAEENSFLPLVSRFDESDDIFGVSGRIYSSDKKSFLYGNRGGYFKYGHFNLYEKGEFDTNTQSLFVCGGGGAFDREKFLSLGGFDTLFSPFYYEEQDISYRALKRGWKVLYEPDSVLYHKVSATILKKKKYVGYISARNNYLFSIKNITDKKYTAEMFLYIPLFLVRDLFRFRFRFWIAFAMALPRIPEAIYKREKEKRYYIYSDAEIFRRVSGE